MNHQDAERAKLSLPLHTWRYGDWVAALLHTNLVVLLALLPFETSAGLPVPGLILNSIELPALLVSGLWLVLLLQERRLPAIPAMPGLAIMLFLGTLLLSAALAPEYQRDALKYALRQIQGGLIALCIAERIWYEGWWLIRRLLLALGIGTAVSALLGLLELSESPLVLAALAIFKTQLSFMGGLLRLSGTFVYANVAAMFYEALLPLACAACLGLLPGRKRLLGAAGLLLLFGAIILTYSRAALLSSAVLMIAVPLVVAWHWGFGRSFWRALGLSAGAGLLVLGLLVGSPTLRLRLMQPEITDWYGARYESAPIADMAPSEVRHVQVRIINTGRVAWNEAGVRPVMLAYHWSSAAGKLYDFEGIRTALPHSLAPGESIVLTAQIRAPQQVGSYRLGWDLVRENGGGWFSQYKVPVGNVPVTVAGQPVPMPPGIQLPRPSVRAAQAIADEPPSPPRGQLWEAALRIWGERPLFGVGPGVFQFIYGPYLGLEHWDTRIHTNNLYLELLVGGGAPALITFLGLVGLVVWLGMRRLHEHQPVQNTTEQNRFRWCLVASILGIAAFLIHGFLDAFLAFMTTNLLFWFWLGMVIGLARK